MAGSALIEIDAVVATVILIALVTAVVGFAAISTSMLDEKVSTFKQMQATLAGKTGNCIAIVALAEENELRRVCSDSLA